MWQSTIGILGGMGPEAHMQFERYLLRSALLPARSGDGGRPPWLVNCSTQIPDRTWAYENGVDIAGHLNAGLRTLALAGADFGVVACVTAHAFLPAQTDRALPIIDLVDNALAHASLEKPGGRLGVLCTRTTYATQMVEERCRLRGLTPILPSPAHRELVMDVIYGCQGIPGLKHGGVLPAHYDMLGPVIASLRGRVDWVLLGCTELCLFDEDLGIPVLDPLQLAADAAIRRARR